MAVPKSHRPGRLRSFAGHGLFESVLLLLLLVLAAAPRVLEGTTALAWTRYHAAQAPLARKPGEHTRQAGHWAAQAVDALAPLPAGAEAARLALSLGQSVESRDRAAALTLYTEVRAALQRARSSRWRGLGLGGLADEAARLADAARDDGPNGRP
jgi:hypothetical protein